jgi:CspA family cold shock protein
MDVPTGVVKFFHADKGYGFIKSDDGGSDIFVHATEAERAGLPQLVEGMRLGFDVETDPRKGKTKAARLRLL